MARWKVQRRGRPAASTASSADRSTSLSGVRKPSTDSSMPAACSRAAVSHSSSSSRADAVNPPWLRSITRNGTSTASRIASKHSMDGVSPSAVMSWTSSRRSAPPRTAARASPASSAMTSSRLEAGGASEVGCCIGWLVLEVVAGGVKWCRPILVYTIADGVNDSTARSDLVGATLWTTSASVA